jgi:integrase
VVVAVRGERNRPLLPDEEARLMSFLTDDRAYLRLIVIIAIQTGLRKGELFSLKRTQVDFVRELIHVTNTKSGRDRFVPMNVVVRSELRKAAEASSADSEYLFANPTSGKPLWNQERFPIRVRRCKDPRPSLSRSQAHVRYPTGRFWCKYPDYHGLDGAQSNGDKRQVNSRDRPW